MPTLRRHPNARFVNTASTAGLGATPDRAAAKHSVIGLTRTLAVDLGRDGITLACPGPIHAVLFPYNDGGLSVRHA